MHARGGRRLLRGAVAAGLALGLATAPAGSAAEPDVAPFVVLGEAPGDRAGHQVTHGDLDGDGIGDLVVGAWQNGRGGVDAGTLYVEYGPVTRGFRLRDADLKLHGAAPFDFVGEGPVAAADLDGDGADELLVGAPGSFVVQQGEPKIGETFLLYGGPRRTGVSSVADVADAVFTGVQQGEWLGFGTAGVGDLDDDGLDDVVLGAPATAGYTGALYVLYGRTERFRGTIPVTDPDDGADATLLGTVPHAMFGYEAAGGDLDGDGTDDLVVAGAALLAPTPGPVHVLYGRKGQRLSGTSTATQSADARLLPTSSSSLSEAWWLSAEHDLTGDGVADLVASNGQATANADRAAHTYVLPGGARLPAVGVLDLLARTTVVGSGSSHATGDVTGDGTPDLVTGDASGSTVSTFAGPVPAGTLTTAQATRTFAPGAAQRAGDALAVGDVTGDGRPDTLVGADEDGVGPGRLHVRPSGT